MIDEYVARKDSYGPRMSLQDDCLQWTPIVSTEMMQEEARTARLEVSVDTLQRLVS